MGEGRGRSPFLSAQAYRQFVAQELATKHRRVRQLVDQSRQTIGVACEPKLFELARHDGRPDVVMVTRLGTSELSAFTAPILGDTMTDAKRRGGDDGDSDGDEGRLSLSGRAIGQAGPAAANDRRRATTRSRVGSALHRE
jgi:hypothetical protein